MLGQLLFLHYTAGNLPFWVQVMMGRSPLDGGEVETVIASAVEVFLAAYRPDS